MNICNTAQPLAQHGLLAKKNTLPSGMNVCPRFIDDMIAGTAGSNHVGEVLITANHAAASHWIRVYWIRIGAALVRVAPRTWISTVDLGMCMGM